MFLYLLLEAILSIVVYLQVVIVFTWRLILIINLLG